jgi:hypothetical protein
LDNPLDCPDKPEAALVQRSDELLFGAAIAHGTPGGTDAGAQGRLRNGAAFPYGFDQLVLGNDPVVIANELDEEFENLRLDWHAATFAAKFVPRDIDFKPGKTKIQGLPLIE